MIKINNINFCEKSIENIEVCGILKEIKCEFHDNIFKITIMNNDGEEVIEVFEEQKVAEVVAETTEEVVQQEVNEEPINKKLTIADVKNIIYENIPKKNTAETYFRSVKQVHDNFKEDDVHELLKKENEIIEFIETKYEKLTTIKNKLCGILKVYNLLNLECTQLKSKIDHYMVSLSIEEDKKKENPIDKKTVVEAEQIVNYFKNELKTMEEELFKDGGSFDTYDKDMELYAILKIYLTYGVLRPSEIIDMKITGTDEGNDKVNYINVISRKIVINNHKNDKNGKKIIDITDDKLNEVLFGGFQFHECLPSYIITNQNGELYSSSSSFGKMFKSRFNDYNPYDLRKCISSLAIHEGNTEKINMLEYNQGHCLNTILKNYNMYNKVDV